MAVTIDWPNAVIQIPRADMTLIQSTPTEIRRLDTNAFRYELRDLEDSEEGRPFPVTHDHNEDVEVGGVQLADVLKIRDPYTITFEDGQYAVYLQGTNNNILEKTNKNQVSVNPNNSAGLVTSSEIQYSVYNGGVSVDAVDGDDIQIYDGGTPFRPTNSIANALVIRVAQKLPKKIYLLSDYTLDAAAALDDFLIVGQSHIETDVIVNAAAQVARTTFRSVTVSGTLDGANVVEYCVVKDLSYVYGHIHDAALNGKITLGGSGDAYIVNCTQLDYNVVPEIDMGGSGQNLVMPDYVGLVKISNSTGAANRMGIGLFGGRVVLASTVTAGVIHVSGIGELVDESGNFIESGTWNGGVTVINTLIGSDTVENIKELHKLQGLKRGFPMTVTPTSRQVDDISQTISGDGETTTTVTRNP